MIPRPVALRIAWAIAAAAFVLRMAYFLEQAEHSVLFSQQLLDEAEARDSARALLAGEGFGPEPLFKAPLYPVAAAAAMLVAGDALWHWALRIVQHALGALLCVMAFDAASRLGGPRRGPAAGIAAAAFMALYPPLIRLENRLVLDFLFAFWTSGLLWALVRHAGGGRSLRWAAVAGAFALLAMWTRPTILPALPVLAWWLAGLAPWRRGLGARAPGRRLAAAGLLLLGGVLAVGSMAARNAMASGEALLLPWQGGFSLYHANRDGATGRYFEQAAAATGDEANPARRLAIDGFLAAVAAGEADPPAEGAFFGTVERHWSAKARAEILGDPARWLRLMAWKGVYLVGEREVYNFEEFRIHKAMSPWLRWNPLGFGVVWPFALASLGLLPCMPRHRRRLFVLVWIAASACAAGIALGFASGRMRAPLVFPAVVLGAAGCAHAWRLARARRMAPLAGAAVLFAAGIVMSWGDWNGVRSESFDHAEFARLSNAAWRDGRHELALEFADRAEAARPGYPPVAQLRGQALFALGRMDDAEDAFRDAALREVANPAAPTNIGVILFEDPARWREARPWFAEALRRDPGHRSARARLALWLARDGQAQAAERELAKLDGGPRGVLEAIASAAAAKAAGRPQEAAAARAALLDSAGEAAAQWLDQELARIPAGR